MFFYKKYDNSNILWPIYGLMACRRHCSIDRGGSDGDASAAKMALKLSSVGNLLRIATHIGPIICEASRAFRALMVSAAYAVCNCSGGGIVSLNIGERHIVPGVYWRRNGGMPVCKNREAPRRRA